MTMKQCRDLSEVGHARMQQREARQFRKKREDGEFTKNLYLRSKGLGEAQTRPWDGLEGCLSVNVPPKLCVKCGEYGHQMLLGSYVKSKTIPVHPRSL